MANFMFNEGFALNQPPMINDFKFEHWQIRMKIYLQSIDIDLWEIVSNNFILNPRSQWNEEDKAKFYLNARAMKILYNAIDEKDFDKIIKCLNAYDIWMTLEQKLSNESCELSKVDELGEDHQQDELRSQPQREEDETDQSPSCSNQHVPSNWDDSEDNDTRIESINVEIHKMCLVANEEEVDSENEVESTFSSDDAYEELKTVYGEVLEDFENTTKKYFEIKSSFKFVSNENDELKIENERLLKEIENLKKLPLNETEKECLLLKEKVKDLTSSLATCTKGEDSLNLLLGKKSIPFQGAGFGFDFSNKGKNVETWSPQHCASTSYKPKAHVKQTSNSSKKAFVKTATKTIVKHPKAALTKPKSSTNSFPNKTCHYCQRHGHINWKCPNQRKPDMIWVIKGSCTNAKTLIHIVTNGRGPKEKWEPRKTNVGASYFHKY